MLHRTPSWALVAASLILLASLAGCDSGSSPGSGSSGSGSTGGGKNLKLAFVTNNASAFWNIARKGIEKAEKELGIHVDMKTPEPATMAGQVRILEDLESQGYQGIAISALHPTDMNRILKRLAGKLNVITHDSDAPESGRLAYIGTNNYEAGKILGREVAKICPKGGKLAVFVGTFSADNARQRYSGIKDALKEAKVEFTEAASKEDNKDLNLAQKNVEDVLNAHPDLDLIIGLWAYNGPAIAKALKAAGKNEKLKVVCFDEDDGTLQGVKDGTIHCTIAQKPFEFGYRSSKLLYELATQGPSARPKEAIIDTGVTVVSKGNVEEFWANLRDLQK